MSAPVIEEADVANIPDSVAPEPVESEETEGQAPSAPIKFVRTVKPPEAPAAPAHKKSREKTNEGALEAFQKSLGEIPPIADLFKELDHQGLKWVPVKRLAIFCEPDKLSVITSGSSINKALGELARLTMPTAGSNIVNLQAEVDPALVLNLMREVLEAGYLVNEIKVGRIQEHEGVPGSYQVVSGRHRVSYAWATLRSRRQNWSTGCA
ncbi:MAG: hypothetical protein MZW92_31245 [Comamonadaceae bacterium]|nr:hypothetical protein [Comamonadaceae bacterium]